MTKKLAGVSTVLIFASVINGLLLACKEDSPPLIPKVTMIDPASGPKATTITITGATLVRPRPKM